MLIVSDQMLFAIALLLASLLGSISVALAEPPLMEIQLGHSRTIWIEEDIATAALGNPAIAETVVIKPNTLLINGKSPGATSLTLFSKSGHHYDYRLLVVRDLSLLQNYLQKIDSGIHVSTDPNGDAVVLTGVVASKAIIDVAEIATIRFFAQPAPAPAPVATTGQQATPPSSLVAPASNPVTSAIRVINLLMTAETLQPPFKQLESLLKQVDERIRVSQVQHVFVLKGKVATPAALSRALAIADRFVSQAASPDITVFSDQGGVLAGNLQTARDGGSDPVDPVLVVQQVGTGRTGGQGGGTVPGAGATGLTQPLHASKGNLAQNIARGDVITVANGRVMSMLQVDDQPRVELQMRIVAVDRNKTDELGIDWRLDGSKVTIGSLHGEVVESLPSPTTTLPVNVGSANLVAALFPGSYAIQAFLRAIEDKGAATTLSEPLLTAISGESTSFLVGGTIPIPAQTLAPGTPTANPVVTTNVIYLSYGLKLIVRPTVLENGKISIVLDQSLSEPDYGKQIKLLGAPVPGFVQKTVSTVTEAEDGEMWAVAGLISEEVSEKLRAVPFISQVPVLGALFRSKTGKASRTELIITVTARRISHAVQVGATRSAAEAPSKTILPGVAAAATDAPKHKPAP